MSLTTPRIGHWYQDCSSNALFEVVAWDPDEGTVQVQYLDGEIADMDIESWTGTALRAAAAPEDWRSAFELDDAVDLDRDAALHPGAWGNPLANFEPDIVVGIEDC